MRYTLWLLWRKFLFRVFHQGYTTIRVTSSLTVLPGDALSFSIGGECLVVQSVTPTTFTVIARNK